MPEHSVGGETCVVSAYSRNLFYYRRQGVSVDISPDRQWWCLWLCSRTVKVDRIDIAIVLDGIVGQAEASDDCDSCGDLRVAGPSFWGFRFGEPYQQVSYRGMITVAGDRFPVSGTIVY